MGLGDDVLARADAYQQWLRTGRRQKILLDGRAQTVSEVWQHTPWIDQQGGDALAHRIQGQRPYVRDINYECQRAPPTWSQEEQQQLAGHKQQPYVLVATDVKQPQHYQHKDWGLDRWQQLILSMRDALPSLEIVRPTLSEKDLEHCDNRRVTVRELMILITGAELVITTEGFAHHWRAQTEQPCVVISGRATAKNRQLSPRHSGTGYNEQLWIGEQPAYYCTDHGCEEHRDCWQGCEPDEVWREIRRYSANLFG